MTSKVETTDLRKTFDEIVRQMEHLDDAFVTIGIHEDKVGSAEAAGSDVQGDDNVTLSEIAFFNEYGTRTAPERSFIRSTVDEKMADFELFRDQQLNEILRGKIDTMKALTKMGFRIRESIKSKIIKGPFVPNAPRTLARKVGNQPLIDSHRMLNSVEYKVDA